MQEQFLFLFFSFSSSKTEGSRHEQKWLSGIQALRFGLRRDPFFFRLRFVFGVFLLLSFPITLSSFDEERNIENDGKKKYLKYSNDSTTFSSSFLVSYIYSL